MKKTISLLMLLILLTIALVACQPASKTITITEENAGQTIEMKNGDTLVVSLGGNITTGFNWIPAPQDPVLLEQVGEAEVTPESDLIGAPGKIVLTFKAIEKGQTNLQLDYKQQWDEITPPEQTYEVTVVVK
jgi:inhibitor of cysteine peptidase